MNATGAVRGGVRKGRSVVAGLLAVIAIVGLLASVIAVWAQNVLFDSDSMVSAVNSALDEPEVTDALAVYITDQVFGVVDVDAYVASALEDNPRLQPLGAALVGGARAVVQNKVEALLAADGTRNAIDAVVERSHDRLMSLLEGDGIADGFTVNEGGEVRVNTLPIVSKALLKVQDLGLFTSFDVPEFTADQNAEDQIAELQAIIDARGGDRVLPPDFGQLTVYQSDALANGKASLSQAQRAIVLVKRSIVAIIAVTLICIVGAIAVAQRRRRMAIGLGLAGVAMLFVARAIIDRVVEQAPTLAIQPGARAAIASTVRSLAAGLFTLLQVSILVGIVLVLVAWLTGASPSATALRSRAGSSGGSAWGWANSHRDAVAIVAAALAVLLIAVAGFSTVTFVIALVLGAVAAWALLTAERGEASVGSGPTVPPAAT